MKRLYFFISIALGALCFLAPFALIHYVNEYSGSTRIIKNHVPLEYIKCLFIYLFFWGFSLAFMLLATRYQLKKIARYFFILCGTLPVVSYLLLITTNGFFFCLFAFLFSVAAIGFAKGKLFSRVGYKQMKQEINSKKQ